ncbi:hypothetical protein NPIL_631411 [Nephila pilipes]|uniref:Uncharacterized protein n=1 Tax=Nephila pilipes TaxID=299642 RepID=A0A8X6MXU3_NEPPI|nr:hypothetical protein NPIL_631411 [Nephila pilipes]
MIINALRSSQVQLITRYKPLTCLDPVDLTANVISADAVELLLPRSAVAIVSATTASVADKRARTAVAETANVVELQNAE